MAALVQEAGDLAATGAGAGMGEEESHLEEQGPRVVTGINNSGIKSASSI